MVLPEEAKRLVLAYVEKKKVNASWLAEQIGEPNRMNVTNWLSRRHTPSDPTIWVRMANALGLITPASTDVEEAARLAGRLNIAWLAGQIGEARQTVHSWLKGKSRPNDPTAWIRMADCLGLAKRVSNEFAEEVHEFAIQVLIRSTDPDLKERAARLVRELSKKYASGT